MNHSISTEMQLSAAQNEAGVNGHLRLTRNIRRPVPRFQEIISASPSNIDVSDRRLSGSSSALPSYSTKSASGSKGLSTTLTTPR